MYEKVIKTYKENFKNFGLPVLLEELLTIDEFVEEGGIADGFMFYAQNSDEIHSGLLPISAEKKKEVLDKLVFLAQADGSGSIYSIIRFNEDAPIESNPIVFFGSEGEILFAAADLHDWLRVISTGVEPNAFDTPISYAVDEDDIEESTQNYRQWLVKKGIQPITGDQKEVDNLISKADIYIPKIINFLNNLS